MTENNTWEKALARTRAGKVKNVQPETCENGHLHIPIGEEKVCGVCIRESLQRSR